MVMVSASSFSESYAFSVKRMIGYADFTFGNEMYFGVKNDSGYSSIK